MLAEARVQTIDEEIAELSMFATLFSEETHEVKVRSLTGLYEHIITEIGLLAKDVSSLYEDQISQLLRNYGKDQKYPLVLPVLGHNIRYNAELKDNMVVGDRARSRLIVAEHAVSDEKVPSPRQVPRNIDVEEQSSKSQEEVEVVYV